MAVMTYEVDGDVAVVTIDNPPVNALSHHVRIAQIEAIERANSDPAVKAIVMICAGRTFFAGADITEFATGLKDPRVGHVLEALEASGKPVVAAIHGTALGGGLETALACHWRVAVADAKFGLPEVNIGLLPGAGGTQRTPRMVGPEMAMEMCTSGKHYDAAFALESGLIDEIVAGDLRAAAVAFAHKVAAEGRPLRKTSGNDDKVRGVDPQIFADFRKKIAKKAKGQLAPWKIIDCIEVACKEPFAAGIEFEGAAFMECLASPQAAALRHLFKAERDARKIPGLEGVKPLRIGKAGVLGAGTMGGGIAMNFANVGIPVVLLDINAEALAKGMAFVEKNYATSVARGSTSQEAMDKAMSLITAATDYSALGDVDIVVEAVFENMDLKKTIFAALDEATPRHAILASNTSSLDVDEIAAATTRPDKFIGTHFFAPPNVMRLLENVRGAKSSPETIATVMELGKTIDKVPVLAGNCNGFIGNRMFQFWNTGWEYLLEEGATPEQVDRVALAFGMAMGPAQVRDMSGLDVACMVRAARAPSLPKEERISPILERLVEAGRLGMKTGAGLYTYDGRTPTSDPIVTRIVEEVAAEFGVPRRAVADDEIIPRMIAPMVNEGAKILQEGIALRASDIDVTYCHGYGFPKHLGGPMYWAEQYGLDKIVAIMEMLAPRFGPRYVPAALLVERAKAGKGW